MHVLYKPCGKKMEVNDTSLSYALSLGWTAERPMEKKEKTATKKAK